MFSNNTNPNKAVDSLSSGYLNLNSEQRQQFLNQIEEVQDQQKIEQIEELLVQLKPKNEAQKVAYENLKLNLNFYRQNQANFQQTNQHQNKQPQLTKPDIFGNNHKESKIKQPEQNQKQSAPGNLFSNIQPKKQQDIQQSASGNLFTGNSQPKKQQDTQQPASGNVFTGNKPTEQQETQQSAPGNLFGNSQPQKQQNIQQSASGNLFTGNSQPKKQQDTQQPALGNVFTGNKPAEQQETQQTASGNLFGSNNLIGQQSTQQTGQNQQSTGGLFGSGSPYQQPQQTENSVFKQDQPPFTGQNVNQNNLFKNNQSSEQQGGLFGSKQIVTKQQVQPENKDDQPQQQALEGDEQLKKYYDSLFDDDFLKEYDLMWVREGFRFKHRNQDNLYVENICYNPKNIKGYTMRDLKYLQASYKMKKYKEITLAAFDKQQINKKIKNQNCIQEIGEFLGIANIV